MLRGKHVLLGITAGIAAYKSAFLCRLLIAEGAEVKVVMTPSAKDFITPLTLSTLSKNPVLSEYFSGNTGEWNSHVELAEWADLFIIAPLSANTLAKMAWGICDNLLLATYFSARCPVFFAPAMDLEMYKQKTVLENIASLQSLGHILIPPAKGELASGLSGEGRMEEPAVMVAALKQWQFRKKEFLGKTILITAGPTREAIDPVRYISNHSSGKMGLAIAMEARRRGGNVIFIHGPIAVKVNGFETSIAVETADEMHKASMKHFGKADVIIMTAAVADYKPAKPAKQKIKKGEDEMVIKLTRNKDILMEMGRVKKKGQFLAGFALETNDEKASALKKLREKNLDLIVLNSMRDKGAGFSLDTNVVSLITGKGSARKLPLMTKTEVARHIIDHIAAAIS